MSSGSHRPPWVAKRAEEAAANKSSNSSSSNDSISALIQPMVHKSLLLKLKIPWNQNENQVYASSSKFVDTIYKWYSAAWTETPEADLVLTEQVTPKGQRTVRLDCKHGGTGGVSRRCELFFSARQIRNSDGRFELGPYTARHSDPCPIRIPRNTAGRPAVHNSSQLTSSTSSKPSQKSSTTSADTLSRPSNPHPIPSASRTSPTSTAPQSASHPQGHSKQDNNKAESLTTTDSDITSHTTASFQTAVAKAKELAAINPPPTKLSISKSIAPLFNTSAASKPAKSPTHSFNPVSSSTAAKADSITASIPSIHTFNSSTTSATVKPLQAASFYSSSTSSPIASASSATPSAATTASSSSVKKTFTAVSSNTDSNTTTHEREISANEAERLALSAIERAEIGHIAISLPMRKSASKESLGSESQTVSKTKASPLGPESDLPDLPDADFTTMMPPPTSISSSSIPSAAVSTSEQKSIPVPTGPRKPSGDPRLVQRAGWKKLSAEERAREPGPFPPAHTMSISTATHTPGPASATSSIKSPSAFSASSAKTSSTYAGLSIKGRPRTSNSDTQARATSIWTTSPPLSTPSSEQMPYTPRSLRGLVYRGNEAATAAEMREAANKEYGQCGMNRERWMQTLDTAAAIEKRAPPSDTPRAKPPTRPTIPLPDVQGTDTVANPIHKPANTEAVQNSVCVDGSALSRATEPVKACLAATSAPSASQGSPTSIITQASNTSSVVNQIAKEVVKEVITEVVKKVAAPVQAVPSASAVVVATAATATVIGNAISPTITAVTTPHNVGSSAPELPSPSPAVTPMPRQASLPTSMRKSANLTVQTKRSVSSKSAMRNTLGMDSFDLLASFEKSAPTSAVTPSSSSSLPSAASVPLFSAPLPSAMNSATTTALFTPGLASAVTSTASSQSPRSPSGSSHTSFAEEGDVISVRKEKQKIRMPSVLRRTSTTKVQDVAMASNLSTSDIAVKQEEQELQRTAEAKMPPMEIEEAIPWSKPLRVATSKRAEATFRKPPKSVPASTSDPRYQHTASTSTIHAQASVTTVQTPINDKAVGLSSRTESFVALETMILDKVAIASSDSRPDPTTESQLDKVTDNKRKIDDAGSTVHSGLGLVADSSNKNFTSRSVDAMHAKQGNEPRKKPRLDSTMSNSVVSVTTSITKKKIIFMSDSDDEGGSTSSSEAEIPIAHLAALQSQSASPLIPASGATMDIEDKTNAEGKRKVHESQTKQDIAQKKRKLTDSVDETVLRALAHEEQERAEREEYERQKAERREAKSARNAERQRRKEEKIKAAKAKEDRERAEFEAKQKEEEKARLAEEERLLKEKREEKERKKALKEEKRKRKEAKRQLEAEKARALSEAAAKAQEQEQKSFPRVESREPSVALSVGHPSGGKARQEDGDKTLVGVTSSSPSKPLEETNNQISAAAPASVIAPAPVATHASAGAHSTASDGVPVPEGDAESFEIILSDYLRAPRFTETFEKLGYKTLGDWDKARVEPTYEVRCELLDMMAQLDLSSVKAGGSTDPIRTWVWERRFKAVVDPGIFRLK